MANKSLELQNYIRLARLTFEGGAVALRGLLRHAAKRSNKPGPSQIGYDDVHFYTQLHQQEYFKITKDDENLKGDYMDWDVSCLYKLLNGLFKDKIELFCLQTYVERIRKNRNTLAHKGKTTISNDEFARLWGKTEQAIHNIIDVLDFDSEEGFLIDTLQISLTEGNFDVVSTLDSILKLTDGESIYGEIKVNLENVKAALDEYATPEMRERTLKSVKEFFEKICKKWDEDKEHLLYKKKRDFEVGIKLRIECDDPTIAAGVMDLLNDMFKAGSTSELHDSKYESIVKAAESLLFYINSLYRTEKVDTQKGSIVLVLRCKKLRSIAEVIECVKDKDLLEHLQEISRAVSGELQENISLQADLQEDIIRRTLEELEKQQPFETKATPISLQDVEKCNIHPGNQIQRFCEDHKVLLCEICIVDHNSCKTSTLEAKANYIDVKDVDGELDGIDETRKEIENMMQTSGHFFDDIIKQDKEDKMFMDKRKQDFEKELFTQDREIKMKKQITKIKLNKAMNRKENEIFELEKHAEHLEQLKASQDKALMFISIHKTKQKLKHSKNIAKEFEKELEQIKKEKAQIKLLPEYKDRMDELLDKAQEVSKMASRTQSLYNVSVRSKKSLFETEKWITGTSFLSDGKLVMVNALKPELLLYDEQLEPLEIISTSSEAWDIAVVTDDEFIVTLPKEKKLVRYKVGKSAPLREIRVRKQCYGICVVSHEVYVSCFDRNIKNEDGEILVLSKDGQHQRNFITKGVSLKWPQCVRVNTSETLLFISDWKTDSVFCFSLDGYLKFERSGLERPIGMYIDEFDNILVCCGRPSNLYAIYRNGKEFKVTNVSDLVWPSSVTYRKTDGKLAIGMWKETGPCVIYET